MMKFFLAVVILFALTGAMEAQSGRRSTGGSTTSTTTTTPSVAGPKTTEKKPAPAPKLQLLVGIDREEVFNNVPYYIYDTVLDNVIRRLGDAFLKEPVEISVSPSASPAELVEQSLVVVAPEQKREALRALIGSEDVKNALIFCNRKRDVDILQRDRKSVV